MESLEVSAVASNQRLLRRELPDHRAEYGHRSLPERRPEKGIDIRHTGMGQTWIIDEN